jgi:hypothetical protein
MKITNQMNIDLPLAVWLLQEGYKSGAADAPPGELLSVTTLMKPTRQLILQRKVDRSQETMDVSELVSSRMGHSLHDSIERAWTEGNWQQAMRQLHYPQSIIDKIRINPPMDKPLEEGIIPIYLEQRGFKPFEDIILTGQLDFLIGSSYRDFKSTSTFSWTSGSKDEDYMLQGSLYRFIFPDLIKDDVMRIEFIFTDWASYRAKTDKKYPQARVAHKEFKLLSLKETEFWLSSKLAEIRKNAKLPQSKMIECNDKQLWRADDVFKYYSNPETAKTGGRCTKRFDKESEAVLFMQEKGKGIVVKEAGEPKACMYCSAFAVCEQRKRYFNDDGSSR